MLIKIFLTFSLILSVTYCDSRPRISRAANVCGNQRRSTGFIVHGAAIKHGDFPWIVALLYTKASPPAFFCGGTLVSANHVITAAHCIRPKYGEFIIQEIFPSDILALFGAYNLSNHHESGRFSISPEKVTVHSDWNPNVERYDADIAVLKFTDDEIPMTRYIKPICLPSIEPSEQEGVVAGWGQSENKSRLHETIPKKLILPIHLNADCFLETPDLAKLSSTRTFCAGLHDGSGVCLGDSGNGFFVKVKNVYFLRGIVSASKTTETSCDVTKYAVYTDITDFKTWIGQIIGEDIFTLVVNEVSIEATTKPVEEGTTAAPEEEDLVKKLGKQISDKVAQESDVFSEQVNNAADKFASQASKLKFW